MHDPQSLAAMEELLQGILEALAPPQAGGSGFDDLLEVRSDLTVAAPEVADKVKVLRLTSYASQPAHAAC